VQEREVRHKPQNRDVVAQRRAGEAACERHDRPQRERADEDRSGQQRARLAVMREGVGE
jgi:hypothetical protein